MPYRIQLPNNIMLTLKKQKIHAHIAFIYRQHDKMEYLQQNPLQHVRFRSNIFVVTNESQTMQLKIDSGSLFLISRAHSSEAN